jgi:glutamine synthetase
MTDARFGDFRFVLLGVPDVHGALRGKAFTSAEFQRVVSTGSAPLTDLMLALDPLDEPIVTFTEFGATAGSGDLLLRPEIDTLCELTWRPGWGLCLATPLWTDGSECELAPRVLLQQILDQAALTDLRIKAAFEYEVRIRTGTTDEPLTGGLSYSFVDLERVHGLVEALETACAGLRIELSAVHTEAGTGLLEINLAASLGLRAADDAAVLKSSVKQLATSLGLRASFLAKPVMGQEGSSGHLHLSCWDEDFKNNLFSPDASGPHGLSRTMANAVGGLLKHMPTMSLMYNPTINSYKRVVPGFFAPTNVSWGLDNRTAAVRAILSGPDKSRLEIRRPGADANPYLVLAAAVASILAGISAPLDPPPPYHGDASLASPEKAAPLPNTLESALLQFKNDPSVESLLGKPFSSYFATSREWEIKAWQRAVTDWERKRYDQVV